MEHMGQAKNDSPRNSLDWAGTGDTNLPAYLRKNKAEGMTNPDTYLIRESEKLTLTTPEALDEKFSVPEHAEASKSDKEVAERLLTSMEIPVATPSIQPEIDVEEPGALRYHQTPQPGGFLRSFMKFNHSLNNFVERPLKRFLRRVTGT